VGYFGEKTIKGKDIIKRKGKKMTLTIKQLDEKMDNIEKFYDQFNMCSYEYPIKDKMYLGRLYQLKLKLKNKPQTSRKEKNDKM